MKKHRHYDKDLKEHICKLVHEEGKKVTEIGREMGINPKTIYGWTKDYKDKQREKNGGVNYVTPNDHQKVKDDLMRQIEELKEENEILKKATNFFMKNQK